MTKREKQEHRRRLAASPAAECPIKCGDCCRYWRDVLDQTPSYFRGYAVDCYIDCPHLGKRGCKLPREKRPAICTHYLCEDAKHELDARKMKRWGQLG